MLIFEGEIFRPVAHNLNKKCVYTSSPAMGRKTQISSQSTSAQVQLSSVSNLPITALPLALSEEPASSSDSHCQQAGFRVGALGERINVLDNSN